MHRRHLLGLTASSLVALSGCASAARNLAGSSGQNGSGNQTTTRADASTRQNVSAPNKQTGTPGSNASVTGSSNVSTPDSSNTTYSGNATHKTTTPNHFPINQPSGPIPHAPVSRKLATRTYAAMGFAHAKASATLYGNWKCPYTRDFVNSNLRDVVKKYVEPGHLRLRFRSLAYVNGHPFLGPDAPRAARAGLAVWNENPTSFWRYFATIFASQPNEEYQWATTDQLLRFAKAANVGHRDRIRTAITSGKYQKPVRETVTDAQKNGIHSVPRLVVGGTVTSPTVDYGHTKRVIEHAIGN